MATIVKRGARFEAMIARIVDGKTIRKSKTFRTKSEANAWAVFTEQEILDGKLGKFPDKTFWDLLEAYIERRTTRWDINRLKLIQRDEISLVKLAKLDSSHVSAWRDRRLKSISSESVRREWALLSGACRVAIKDLKWMNSNPFTEAELPKKGAPRTRLYACDEIDAILTALGWYDGVPPETVSIRIGYALLFALEVGMRCGEICDLRWDDISPTVARIKKGKTLAASRVVPMTKYAIQIIKILEDYGTQAVFDLTPGQVDALFRKARDRCGIENLTFHDSRATAITRLSKKLDILDLARMIGHSDLKQLMVYYRESAEDIAKRL